VSAGRPDLTNDELSEELALAELPEELWIEVSLRLGVEESAGIRAAAVSAVRTGDDAARLRRYMELWADQPEARTMRPWLGVESAEKDDQ
jgi:hypothetical protein